MITKELFQSIYNWTLVLENDEPLKKAIDAMLCSICCIKPEIFPLLLQNMGVLVPNMSTDVDASISDDRKDPESMTDDIKQEESDTAEWYSHLVIEDITRLSLSSSNLHTIAMACQSPLAIQQLLDSGLPRLLISIILEFCFRTLTSDDNSDMMSVDLTDEQTTCLTDSDKVENSHRSGGDLSVTYPMVNIETIADILEFFSEICSEGHMRDWLGSYAGSVFWKPLLDILCNNSPLDVNGQNYTQLEQSMIKLLSKVSACHPKNQEALTINLISAIRKPGSSNGSPTNLKCSISGFTRRLVLQLLLESEKILVSVRSDRPLHRKEQFMGIINNHPSKRPNAHHLLFYLRTHTKCQEILDNCVSAFNNISSSSTSSSDTRSADFMLNPYSSSTPRKELMEISSGMGLGMEYLSVAAGVTAKDKRSKDVKNQVASIKAKDLCSKLRMKLDESISSNSSDITQLTHLLCPGVVLTSDTTISQILAMLKSLGISLSTPCISLNLIQSRKTEEISEDQFKVSDYEPLPSPLQIFSGRGGLSLLAYYLPTVYPEAQKLASPGPDKEKSPPSNDWVKVEPNDDIYEDVDDTLTDSSGKMANTSSVPQHSLAAFGLFLRLPAYSDVLLRDKIKAQCLLRLVLGVTGDGEGSKWFWFFLFNFLFLIVFIFLDEIYSLTLASSLPTLPFEVSFDFFKKKKFC